MEPCENKARYTHAEAIEAAARINTHREYVKPYLCKTCDIWHLAGTGNEKGAKIRKRTAKKRHHGMHLNPESQISRLSRELEEIKSKWVSPKEETHLKQENEILHEKVRVLKKRVRELREHLGESTADRILTYRTQIDAQKAKIQELQEIWPDSIKGE